MVATPGTNLNLRNLWTVSGLIFLRYPNPPFILSLLDDLL